LTRFYLVLLFSADNYLIILPKASSLTRRRVCSLQWNHSLVPITILYCLIWDCVPFLSPITTRRDYGGGILTRLHTGKTVIKMPVNLYMLYQQCQDLVHTALSQVCYMWLSQTVWRSSTDQLYFNTKISWIKCKTLRVSASLLLVS
jgi:hypothetical protein